jgi:hypothetical protein
MFHVVGVHGADLIASGSSQDLDNLDQLVNARLTGEQRLTEHELSHDTASGPDIYRRQKGQSRASIWQCKLYVPIFVV